MFTGERSPQVRACGGEQPAESTAAENTTATEETTASYADLTDAVAALSEAGYEAPDPAAYGTFISSIPDAVSGMLEKANCADS